MCAHPLGSEGAWQPIETAPKTGGQEVLLWDGDDVSVAYYSIVGWTGVAAGAVAFWEERRGSVPDAIHVEPTHWMPLPKPPVSSGSQLADANKKDPDPA